MDRAERWARRMRQTDNTEAVRDKARGYAWRAVMYKTSFDGLLQGTMGNSFKYNEPVWDMIKERIPVSLYFGILSAIITYSVCIPLGVVKAIRHKKPGGQYLFRPDFPGVLRTWVRPGRCTGGVSGRAAGMVPSLRAYVSGLCGHGVLATGRRPAAPYGAPLICYVVSSFAITTMMMKNNLMDNLSADYIRTAMAKGVSFRGPSSSMPSATPLYPLPPLWAASSA